MKILVFNGSSEIRPNSALGLLIEYINQKLVKIKAEVILFNLSEAGIPLLEMPFKKKPAAVETMISTFRAADLHIWLSPLYHGSIPGTMKNCLDWIELSSKLDKPYLTDKIVAQICWADGEQAMQGITTMDAVAKVLRAWPLPYCMPIKKSDLYDPSQPGQITLQYRNKLDTLLELAVEKKIKTFETSSGF